MALPYPPRPPCPALVRTTLIGLLTFALCACGGTPPYPVLGDYPVPQQAAAHAQRLTLQPGVEARTVAAYSLTAHVMRTERYWFDAMADVVPVDFALAWGPAATPEVQERLTVSQSGRWFHWRVASPTTGLPSMGALSNAMANVHMVPATAEVRAQLLAVRAGDSIRARGWLVDIEDVESKRTIRTSRT